MEENIQIIISVNGEDTFNTTLPKSKARNSILINTSLNAIDEKEEQTLRYDIPFTLSNASEACTILFTFLLFIDQIFKTLRTTYLRVHQSYVDAGMSTPSPSALLLMERYDWDRSKSVNDIYEEIVFGKILSDDLLFDLLILSVRFNIPFLVELLLIKLAIIIKKNNVSSLRKRFHIHNIHRKTAPVGTLVQLKDYDDLTGSEARIVKHGDTGKTVIVNSNVTGQDTLLSYDNIDIVDTDRFTMLWFTLFYNQNPIRLFLDNDDKYKLQSLQDDKPDTLFTAKVKQLHGPSFIRRKSWEELWDQWEIYVALGLTIPLLTSALGVFGTKRKSKKREKREKRNRISIHKAR